MNNEIAWLYSQFTFTNNLSGELVLQPVSIATCDLSTFRAFDFLSRYSSSQKALEYSGLHHENVMPFLQPLDNFNGRAQSVTKPLIDQFIVPFWLLYKQLGPADPSATLGSSNNPLSYSSASYPSAIVQEIRSPEEVAALARNSPVPFMGIGFVLNTYL